MITATPVAALSSTVFTPAVSETRQRLLGELVLADAPTKVTLRRDGPRRPPDSRLYRPDSGGRSRP
jgi:hypothetical protein